MSLLFGWAAGWLAIELIVIIVLFWLSWNYFDQRYHRRRPPGSGSMREPGFAPTNEVFIDPKDGFRYRVYFNSRTGEREYIRED